MRYTRITLVLLLMLLPLSAMAQRNIQRGKDGTETFVSFFAAFRDAINKQDRAALKSLMGSTFEWAGDGKDSRDVAIRNIDLVNLWQKFRKSVAGKTINCKIKDPACWHYPIPARRTVGPSWLLFQLDSDGKWRWVALLGD